MTMEKITIAKDPYGGYRVCQGDRYSDQLTFDEMFGVLMSLILPNDKRANEIHEHWMRTKEEWDKIETFRNNQNWDINNK